MSRILITGSRGFTGRYLIDRLQRDDYELHGLEHRSSIDPIKGLTQVHVADLKDADALANVVDRVRPSFVIHLAAIPFVAYDDVSELYATNVVGTRNLLQALAQVHRPERILLSSSANIYGNQHAGILTESMPAEPANDYGVSKLACEHIARIYSDRLPIIITRPFNYTGIGQSTKFIVPKIVQHIRDRAPCIELGNLDVARDFSDVRSVVDCYARLLKAPEAIGQTFNVCSGQAHTLADVIGIAERAAGHEIEVRTNPAFVREGEVKVLCGSRGKLENVIGPIGMPTLEETLKWMIEE